MAGYATPQDEASLWHSGAPMTPGDLSGYHVQGPQYRPYPVAGRLHAIADQASQGVRGATDYTASLVSRAAQRVSEMKERAGEIDIPGFRLLTTPSHETAAADMMGADPNATVAPRSLPFGFKPPDVDLLGMMGPGRFTMAGGALLGGMLAGPPGALTGAMMGGAAVAGKTEMGRQAEKSKMDDELRDREIEATMGDGIRREFAEYLVRGLEIAAKRNISFEEAEKKMEKSQLVKYLQETRLSPEEIDALNEHRAFQKSTSASSYAPEFPPRVTPVGGASSSAQEPLPATRLPMPSLSDWRTLAMEGRELTSMGVFPAVVYAHHLYEHPSLRRAMDDLIGDVPTMDDIDKLYETFMDSPMRNHLINVQERVVRRFDDDSLAMIESRGRERVEARSGPRLR